MNKKLLMLSCLFAALMFVQCGKKEEPKKEVFEDEMVEEPAATEATSENADPFEGKAQTNCYICHNDDKEAANRLAPHFSEIVAAYKSSGASKEDAIAKMAAYAKSPSEDKAVIKSAIDEYGQMAAIALDDTELNGIVGYIVNKYY